MRPQKSRGNKAPTPLDAKQKALTEEEEKLRQQMQKLERLIQDAPKLRELKEKKEREERIARASQQTRGLGTAS